MRRVIVPSPPQRALFRRAAPLAVVGLLLGCPSIPPTAELTDVADPALFPAQVGEYQRWSEPSWKTSVGYNRYDFTLQNAVTLYFNPRECSLAEQFAAEKEAILSAHPGSVVLDERELSISTEGSSVPALLATFRYDEVFANRRQPVFSELVLISLPDEFCKVRSSAPLGQALIAEASMFELLGQLGWKR